MGYVPTLVILKKDLDKHRDLLEDGSWQYDGSQEKEEKGEAEQTVMEYLQHIHKRIAKGNYATVGGVELIICEPSLSNFNRAVRNKLTELNIDFGTNN